jgi:thioredoxin:protein disulfide reductase
MDPASTSTGLPAKPLRPESALGRRLRAVLGALACLWVSGVHAAGNDLLPPEQAFRFSARALDDSTLEARFAVVDGYYLYRDKFKFTVMPDGATLGTPELPPGKIKTDQFFGKVETYRGIVVVKLPLSGAAAGKTVVLVAESQGCADLGVCYPPTRQQISLLLPAAGSGPGPVLDATPPKKNWFK